MNLLIKLRLFILLLIVVTQIFSPVLVVPGGEGFGGSVFRLVLLLSGGILIVTVGFVPLGRDARYALIAGGLLALWMMISLSWTDEIGVGIRHVSYIITILLLIYVLDILISGVDEFKFINRSILGLGCLVLAASFYELYSGNHYFRAHIQDVANYDISRSHIANELAWFTFGNPNDLAVHVAFCAMISIFFASRKLHYVLSAIFMGLTYLLCEKNDARLVILSLLSFGVVYSLSAFRKNATSGAFIAALAVATFAVVLNLALFTKDQIEFFDLAIFVRLQLVMNALEMAVHSLFIGIGAGGFEAEMWAGGLIGTTYGIVNPHNAIARMFAENGVIGLALFGFLLVGPLLTLRRAGHTTRLSVSLSATVAALPLLLSSGSDPLSSSTLQLAIALMWVGCRVTVQAGSETATISRSVNSTR